MKMEGTYLGYIAFTRPERLQGACFCKSSGNTESGKEQSTDYMHVRKLPGESAHLHRRPLYLYSIHGASYVISDIKPGRRSRGGSSRGEQKMPGRIVTRFAARLEGQVG